MKNLKNEITKLPENPGVYIYRNRENQIIYVGKAVNLKRRVSQYFQPSYQDFPKIKALTSEITEVKTISTISEFDALMLEAQLIRVNQPKYNSIARDDRSPLYVVITFSEKLPHIIFARKFVLAHNEKLNDKKNKIFGPYQSAKLTKQILRQIRRIIPYCTQNRRDGKPCFYTQLGLCSPCPSYIEKLNVPAEKKRLAGAYRRHLRLISLILAGSSQRVMRELTKQMKNLAKMTKFEEANILKIQIEALERLSVVHYDPELYLSHDLIAGDIGKKEIDRLTEILKPFYPDLTQLYRIEAYDISNLAGKLAVGSMVVLTKGLIDKNEYRKFKIRTKHTPDDPAMMSEVISRRLHHADWPDPDVIVVDGGKAQIQAAISSLRVNARQIPVIGLAKKFEQIIVPHLDFYKILTLEPNDPGLQIIQRLRDEAHRFALSYHHKLRAIPYRTR